MNTNKDKKSIVDPYFDFDLHKFSEGMVFAKTLDKHDVFRIDRRKCFPLFYVNCHLWMHIGGDKFPDSLNQMDTSNLFVLT